MRRWSTLLSVVSSIGSCPIFFFFRVLNTIMFTSLFFLFSTLVRAALIFLSGSMTSREFHVRSESFDGFHRPSSLLFFSCFSPSETIVRFSKRCFVKFSSSSVIYCSRVDIADYLNIIMFIDDY